MRILTTVAFAALLMTGCGNDSYNKEGDRAESNLSSGEIAEINFDDLETRKKIIAEAIGRNQLQHRQDKGDELAYAPKAQATYSGWEKEIYDNGTIWRLSQWKDGKRNGVSIWWHENGNKSMEENYKNGKRDGLETEWFENGQKELEANYKGGKQDGLETGWYENGQKEYNGNWKDAQQDGLWVFYNEDGTEKNRITFKDGEVVRD